MSKKKIIIILIIIALIAVGVFFAVKSSKKSPEYSTFTVQRGDLKQSVEATGKVESADRIELNFKTTGRIEKILVKVGQAVTVDQQLAALNSRALQSKVDDARAGLNQTLADYDKLLAGASAQDIQIAEDTVAQELQDLNTAKNDLANLKSKRDTELENLKASAMTSLDNEIVVAQGAMDEVDNTLTDTDAENTLSIQDSAALARAQNNQVTTNNAVGQSKAEINLIELASSDNDVLTALNNLTATLNKVAENLSDVLDVLAATVTSDDLSETELDALKTNIKSQQTKINTAKSNLQTAKSNWTNKIASYQDLVSSAQDAVTQAEKALNIASSKLALEKSPPRDFEIKAAQAKVDQAQAALNLALANLEEAIITAPLDGRLTKKNYEVGEQTSLTAPVLEMIGQSNLQIEVNIPESDIAKLKLGQEVEITLDAFGDDQVFAGTVTFVDPAETLIQDVVYYQVKVQFSSQQNQVKPGMTANVTICTNKKSHALFVPARAVKSRDGEKYVQILIAGVPEEKTVATGMRGDQGLEIISGLVGGEEVVTFVKE